MKIIFGSVLLASVMALTACGGDSSSSSQSYTSTLGNGNKYSCPSKEALNLCKSDATCKAASCEMTYEAVAPVPETGGKCKVEGNTFYGDTGQTCNVSIDKLNGGAETELTCTSGGAIILGNGLQATSGTIQLGEYTLTCNK